MVALESLLDGDEVWSVRPQKQVKMAITFGMIVKSC